MPDNVSLREEQPALRDRFRGTLLGIAVGDALGAPLEFQPARSPDHYLTEMVGGGWLQLAPGEWTDDTQLTLATVQSLLERKVFDPDDIARRFVDWYNTRPPDVGNHIRQVLEAIKGGKPWQEASALATTSAPENAPNGSLMRCAPLSLFFYKNPDFVATLSPVLSRITHAHPDCEQACVFLNVTIALLLSGSNRSDAVNAGLSAIPEASYSLRERIARATQNHNAASPSGWVLDTLEVALWSFLHTPSLEAALLVAVNRGDDADTVGAVTGALAGAHYGLSQIPERWLQVLKAKDVLIEYSDQLLDLAQDSN